MKIDGVALALALMFVAAGCSNDAGDAAPSTDGAAGAAGGDAPWFADVTESSGIDFVHTRGPGGRYLFPEIMCGGGGVLDYDGDGDLDLYLVQSGDLDPAPGAEQPSNRLYRNDGSWRFTDVTEAAGVGDRGYGMGCTCGDYDGDGDVDIYVTNVGANVLYRNNGDGTFTDVTAESGTGDGGWGTSCAMLDHDGDGDLDLFVTNYITWSLQREMECRAGSGERDYCNPSNYNAPAPDVLYRNDGGGRFTDVSEAAGLRRAFGNGLGVACADYNGDGRMDIYVANDGMPNQLWINQGDGRFLDEALTAGCAVNMQGAAEAGMGVAAVDIESDGDQDLFITHLRDESNTFYLNDGGIFDDTTAQSGLSHASIRYTGFGMGFADFDHDGELDLYIANGRVGKWSPDFTPDDPYAEPNQAFRGRGGARFAEIAPHCAGCPIGNSRAAIFGDLDGDGGIDVVVVNNDGAARVLRNEAPRRGGWITLRVLDRNGADALGAAVEIEAGGRVQRRLVQVTYSYCASNDPRVHVGLGDAAQVERVTVRWPDGETRTVGPLAAGTVHVIR